MSTDELSTFPPNSRQGNNQDDQGSHMCYCPAHLDLSAPKDSVAEWVGTAWPLHQGEKVHLVTFNDGSSTVVHSICGVSSVALSLLDEEPEAGEEVLGHATRGDMETAGIYEDYKKAFEKVVSLRLGTLNPTGDFDPVLEGNPEFQIDREAMAETKITVFEEYQKFVDNAPIDQVARNRAMAWEVEWSESHPEIDNSEYEGSGEEAEE
ncbi:hypothetical protein L202_08431 [Cryptococcus amylolentus CBS 6039]|uniref:Uncharacterized protein n=2 Tax=Cryptococcus amylolentus TaxID=104669 RepID=A0A1E3HB74_9TREE|nr:hypothetical protein L202_08431 [Cryptococcus amylolentus CBS 6039]ODN73036.1 hypothetical protein L202_08431 [Cryptococcus amylolentus CBS 6039]ODN98189.1 hypothetical protein I350_07835 [Cryptococcus amylolentus CBS 6273]